MGSDLGIKGSGKRGSGAKQTDELKFQHSGAEFSSQVGRLMLVFLSLLRNSHIIKPFTYNLEWSV